MTGFSPRAKGYAVLWEHLKDGNIPLGWVPLRIHCREQYEPIKIMWNQWFKKSISFKIGKCIDLLMVNRNHFIFILQCRYSTIKESLTDHQEKEKKSRTFFNIWPQWLQTLASIGNGSCLLFQIQWRWTGQPARKCFQKSLTYSEKGEST